jgi:K+/H+ antiporter YhaU regulatory subunit KhtT
MTIEQQIYQNSIKNPELVALISGEQQVTYTQMWKRCLLAATNVRKKYNLKQGDRIILAGSDTDVAAFQKMLETSLTPNEEMDSRSSNIILDNFTITADSPLCGKSILKSGIRDKGGCIVMGLVRPSEDFYTNPDPNLVIQEDDIIIVAGEEQKMHDFFS